MQLFLYSLDLLWTRHWVFLSQELHADCKKKDDAVVDAENSWYVYMNSFRFRSAVL